MLIGKKENFLRKAYDYNRGLTVVEYLKDNGNIWVYTAIAGGRNTTYHDTFENVCAMFNIDEVRILNTKEMERK